MEVRISTLCSTRNQFSFLKWDGFIWSRGRSSKQKHVFVLSNLKFSFQGLTQESIPWFTSIVKVRLYGSITQQSSKRIIQIDALPHKKFSLLLIFKNSTSHWLSVKIRIKVASEILDSIVQFYRIISIWYA